MVEEADHLLRWAGVETHDPRRGGRALEALSRSGLGSAFGATGGGS